MTTTTDTPNLDLNELIEGLRREDDRNLHLTNRFKWLMWIFAPLYFCFFLFMIYEGEPILKEIGFFFFSVSFLFFAIVFRNLNNEYKSVDYGLPTTEMLRKAVQRYEIWQTKTVKAMAPAFLAAIGVSLSSQEMIPNIDDTFIRVVVAFFAYLVILCIGFGVGYLIWRKRQKPLRDHALLLLAELEK
jgi:hypothetical protein